jgi:hypothetical protein
MTEDVTTIMAPALAWHGIALDMTKIGIAANEVMWRRSLMTAFGALSLGEAREMILEKPLALAGALGGAMAVAASGGTPAAMTAAAIDPYQTRTESNARRLRG